MFHNNDLNQVTWELRAMGGAPKFEESQTLPDVSYADFARSIGLEAIDRRRAGRARPGLGPRAARRPAGVLDVHCDPEVPPIPPHATWDQLKDTAEAVLKGDPDAWHLMAQGVKTKAQEFIPRDRADPRRYAD